MIFKKYVYSCDVNVFVSEEAEEIPQSRSKALPFDTCIQRRICAACAFEATNQNHRFPAETALEAWVSTGSQADWSECVSFHLLGA